MNPTELVITVVEGLSSYTPINCGFTDGIPHWKINESIYDLNKVSYPNIVLDGIYGIQISSITVCLNDTTFQCLSSRYHTIGRVARLIVIESEFYC